MQRAGHPDFGSFLRDIRHRAGFSQNELAKRTGINAAYVNRLEKGSGSQMSRSVALSMARALHLDDRETDAFLYRAGLAPLVDWQARALQAERTLQIIRLALTEQNQETA